MVIDIGRILGFYRMPATQSWIFAGRSYQMAQFCQSLYNLRCGTTETLFNPEEFEENAYRQEDDTEKDDEENPEVFITATDTFKPGGTVSTFLRLCLHKIWADMLITDKFFSVKKLLSTDTIKVAVEIFNTNSHMWSNCKTKQIPYRWIPSILKTATGWELAINAKRRENSSAQEPEGECFTSWTSKQSQKDWENYYCTVIGNTKCIAPRTDRAKVRQQEGVSESAQARKKKKQDLRDPEISPIVTPSIGTDGVTGNSTSSTDLTLASFLSPDDTDKIFKEELDAAKNHAAQTTSTLLSLTSNSEKQIEILTNSDKQLAELNCNLRVLAGNFGQLLELMKAANNA